MKSKELFAAIAILRRMLADPTMESCYRRKLDCALRELERLKQSGKLPPKRVFRVVKLVSEALWEMRPIEAVQDDESAQRGS